MKWRMDFRSGFRRLGKLVLLLSTLFLVTTFVLGSLLISGDWFFVRLWGIILTGLQWFLWFIWPPGLAQRLSRKIKVLLVGATGAFLVLVGAVGSQATTIQNATILILAVAVWLSVHGLAMVIWAWRNYPREKQGARNMVAPQSGQNTSEAKSVGEALDIADSLQRREIKEWRDRVGELLEYLNGITEKPDSDQSRARRHAKIAQALYNEIDQSTRSWTRTKEEIEARKSYMDLQAKIVDAWPKRTVAESLLFVGSGFLGAGGVAYAYLGAPEIVVYALFWTIGIVCLGGALYGLNKYDSERAEHFQKIRGRLE